MHSQIMVRFSPNKDSATFTNQWVSKCSLLLIIDMTSTRAQGGAHKSTIKNQLVGPKVRIVGERTGEGSGMRESTRDIIENKL